MTGKLKLPHSPTHLKSLATAKEKENRQFIRQLSKQPQGKVFKQIKRVHDEVFAETDCLDCANCCKTTSPVFKQRDIKRLAKFFRLKDQEFIETYLYLDEEGDYVLKSAPCPFLLDDNKCIAYEHRPDACRNYPHTDKKPLRKIKSITLKNTFVCPAVFEIIERLKRQG